ncbi:PQQ-dependent sugar dehydrogenase [Haloactinopolyspora sp.]|uniref:PQQ-dependent sugar dehydrogenase n=1 Tax=Haloactinopolyspora sp. TaxID=1966353 RepID=UPI002602B67A|nr:PQQ-dependent sugar dehydrogenase [Haloactinopolyspora sp.]
MSARHAVLAAVLAVSLAASCSSDDGGDGTQIDGTAEPSSSAEPSTPLRTGTQTPTTSPVAGPVTPAGVDEIVTGLDAPWAIAFIDDSTALVSQRDADTIVQVDDSGSITEVGTVPDVEGGGEGGLLGIAFDPGDASMLYVYATLGSENAVMRTTFTGGELGEFETVLDGIPAGTIHNGGRLRFGPDGMLYVSTGETGEPDDAQDVESLGGKILRITPDGQVPADNPFDGSPVYSYGHRNVQGLAFDDDGRLWASEFGDRDADELNLIEPGENYGWPEVEGVAGDDRFIDPEVEWRPTAIASPSGLAYVRDTFFVTALRGERLWQVPLVDGETGEPTSYLEDFGRLRDAAVAPDGTLWVLTNNTDGRGDPRDGDDRILRVTLAP